MSPENRSASLALTQPQPASAGYANGAPAAAMPGVRGPLVVCFVVWFLVLGDIQWFFANKGLVPILKLPTILLGIAFLAALSRGPRKFFPPLLAFAAYTALSVPFAFFRQDAIDVGKVIVVIYILSLTTLTLVTNIRQAVPLVLWTLLFQFTWWGVLGARIGKVPWEGVPYLNYDGYGPLMTLAIGTSYFMAMASTNKRLRLLALFTAGVCVIGLISSFARGAIASTAVVAVWVWLRSPNKLRTLGVGVLGVGVLFLATNVFFANVDRGSDSKRNIWEELQTISDTGGTRSDRNTLWKMATLVYKQQPLFGAGPGNFGAYAARHLEGEQVTGDYAGNPASLWGRRLHNVYFQTLSEWGTVGAVIMIWLLIDFALRNRALRKPDRIALWHSQWPTLKLREISLALEVMMVGFLLTGYFYNTLVEVPWLYTIVTINYMLFHLTKPVAGRVAQPGAIVAAVPRRTAGWRSSEPRWRAPARS